MTESDSSALSRIICGMEIQPGRFERCSGADRTLLLHPDKLVRTGLLPGHHPVLPDWGVRARLVAAVLTTSFHIYFFLAPTLSLRFDTSETPHPYRLLCVGLPRQFVSAAEKPRRVVARGERVMSSSARTVILSPPSKVSARASRALHELTRKADTKKTIR